MPNLEVCLLITLNVEKGYGTNRTKVGSDNDWPKGVTRSTQCLAQTSEKGPPVPSGPPTVLSRHTDIYQVRTYHMYYKIPRLVFLFWNEHYAGLAHLIDL